MIGQGHQKKFTPLCICGFIKLSPEVIPLLLMIKEYNLTSLEIRKIANKMTAVNSKALIVAAGMGSRLKPYTASLPKCMLQFGGKTLLQRQLEIFQECCINDIFVAEAPARQNQL